MKRLGQGPVEGDVRLLRVLLGRCGLAQPSGWLPFATVDYCGNISTSGILIFKATIPRTLTIRTWHQSAEVLTTNNASNYWTITLYKAETTSITSVTTAAMTAGTWSVLSDTDIGASVSTTDISLAIHVAKTGSPGNLYLTGPAVFVT